MNQLVFVGSASAVALIYGVWRYYRDAIRRRQALLRERVAFMLWQAAQRAD